MKVQFGLYTFSLQTTAQVDPPYILRRVQLIGIIGQTAAYLP